MNSHERETAERFDRRGWPVTPIRAGFELSFEYFPAATSRATEQLGTTANALDALAPTFVSVTYGAGGSSQDRTLATIESLRGSVSSEVAGHLTSVGATRDEVLAVVDRYRSLGVSRIIALRGDPPADGGNATVQDGFRDAAELVAGIRSHCGDAVDLSVAAYPEVHPLAASPRADLDNLKRKLDAGADRAITQFFFDTDAFLRFHDAARAAGVTAPIVPGIMPITDFDRVSGFARRCGTSIPDWLPDLFAGLGDAPEIHQMVAATVAAEQCRRLAEHGVRAFHFYTMNRPELTLAVGRILGAVPAVATATLAS